MQLLGILVMVLTILAALVVKWVLLIEINRYVEARTNTRALHRSSWKGAFSDVRL
jgi:hypothetical protein